MARFVTQYCQTGSHRNLQTKPFGSLSTAQILVIGHDPNLQRSRTVAEYPFFLDYLERPRPTIRPEARKYGLAIALQNYISDLAGRHVEVSELYATNLCNERLERQGRGTMWIPDEQAERGVDQIKRIASRGHFKVILPLSLQTFYQLCKLSFIDEDSQLVRDFIVLATPRPASIRKGLYEETGRTPFLLVCGKLFHHQGISVVPVLHVKQWPLQRTMVKYTKPMQDAQGHVQDLLAAYG